jgi:hypothetical protein
MPKRLKVSEFVTIAQRVHGDKYDYSKTHYINSHTDVVITCPIHGDFSQRPNNHINNKGCHQCGQDQTKLKLISTTPEFISKANKVHGKIYDYSIVNYIGNKNKADIICKLHGQFKQTPDAHLSGKGCEKCYHDNLRMTTKEFVKAASNIHRNKYDYSKVLYGNNTQAKVAIICPKHGRFTQSPNKHLSGRGCRKCGYEKSLKNFVSKKETKFLNSIGIQRHNRQQYVHGHCVDGYDPQTNTIYEFLGDYWHGNPCKFKSEDYNQRAHKTFGELYDKTFSRLSFLKNNCIVKYIWENDWDLFLKYPNTTLKIQTL